MRLRRHPAGRDVPAFIVAQLVGAVAASLAAGWLFAEPGKTRGCCAPPFKKSVISTFARPKARKLATLWRLVAASFTIRCRHLARTGVGFGSQAAIVVATSDFSFLNRLRSSTNLAVAVVPGQHS
jgi:hypothetical protein